MNYSKMKKEDLINLIEELKIEKYGLSWDRETKPEKVVNDCKNYFPILKEFESEEVKQEYEHGILPMVDNKVNVGDKHILIEGDNYHALSVLNYTHNEKIDVIIIDPPYNTGNKDFKYNDNFVDKEDTYRHSKWLNFMYKRLIIARELLKDTGIIFLSIDDNEQAQLKLLCDKIFGEDNVETMIWEKTGHGKKGGTGRAAPGNRFGSEHEYIIVCYKDKSIIKYNKIMELPNYKNEKKNVDNDLRGPWESGNISASNYKNKKAKNYYTVFSPSNVEISRNWLKTKEEFKKLNNDNRIYWGKDNNSIPRHKIFINEKKAVSPSSIIKNKGSLTYGKDELEEILGIKMDDFTPKPTMLIKHLIKIVESNNKDLIVLDFFAGSGTTGHVVLELNKEDGGNRQFILCTNNEGGICKEVCYPRLKKAINGYQTSNGKKIEALGGSFKYFKTDLIKQRKHETQDKINISHVCAEMLCLKENIFNLEKNTKNYKIYSSDNKDKWLIVYYDMYGDAVKECEDEINKLTGKKIIYIFTLGGPPFLWDESIERLEKDKTNDIRLIPERILMAYRDVINMSQ